MKIFSFKAGNTLDCERRFIKKLIKRGATEVDSIEKSNAIIVFCPIVSRFETDVKAALSSLPAGKHAENASEIVILCFVF